jgi:general secretion pathway protein G
MFKDKRGFTLIELLVVIAILGILVTFVATRMVGRTDDAKINQAKIQIQSLGDAVKMYKLDNGIFPSTEQGLNSLVVMPSVGTIPKKWKEGGYLEKSSVPKDPWDNEYVYMNPGTHNPNSFDLFSYGPDGPGGDSAKIIGNWDSESEKTEQTQ